MTGQKHQGEALCKRPTLEGGIVFPPTSPRAEAARSQKWQSTECNAQSTQGELCKRPTLEGGALSPPTSPRAEAARSFPPCALLSALCLLLCHCSTARFYTQAISGHLEIQRAAKPSERLLADPATPDTLRQKLETIADIRRFAETQLALPAKRQYHRYADLKREHLVWVVFAAPEFSMKPRTWHYPLLGSLSYRGYFKQARAETLAAKHRAQGDDVFIAEVDAYSTLGWFSDPVLNTFIDLPDRDLAELLFHELTHQRLYFPGDTDFNEALATAVGREGTLRWLTSTRRTRELAAYNREDRILSAFLRELAPTRAALETLYARDDLVPDAMRAAKAAIFKDLRRRADALNQKHGGTLKIDKWFRKPVNNARLLSISAYHDLVPAFETLLKKHSQGDLEPFFQTLQTTRRLSPERRRAWLQSSSF